VDDEKVERLGKLGTAGRFDQMIEEVTEEEAAQAWTRYQQTWHERGANPDIDDPDFWAVDLLAQPEWWADERRLRDGILRLVELARSDYELEFIGITFMEGGFFSEDPSRLDWVEVQAARSDRFRRTLGNLYLNRESDAIRRRVERAARDT